jgi:hypothetical protein
MTNLLDLPTELLILIMSEVQYGSCRLHPDFLVLRQLCRKLLSVIDPFFFHSFKLEKSYRDSGARFVQFATAVARRPELRKNVKSVELHLERTYGYIRRRQVWVPEQSDLSALRDAAPTYFENNNETMWTGPTKKNSRNSKGNGELKWEKRRAIAVYPHVTALLSLLPNLEVLRIKSKDPATNRGLRRLKDLMPLFSNLKELSLCPQEQYHDATLVGFRPLAPLLRLPQLRTLALKHLDMENMTANHAADVSTRFDDICYAQGSLAIENLTIRKCSITSDSTAHLIQACQRLRSFHYREWEDEEVSNDVVEPQLDVQGLHDALSLHKDTLSELLLDYTNGYKMLNGVDEYDPLTAWPSFTSFVALKTLKIEYRRMTYPSLPPNIEHLYLFDCREIEGESEIDGWIAIQTYCPQIKLFEIMTTEHCRNTQSSCKRYGFRWGCLSERMREWTKGGFELKVWFKEFVDGAYQFTEGTDDTSEYDWNGEIAGSDEEGEEDYDDGDQSGEENANQDGEAGTQEHGLEWEAGTDDDADMGELTGL